MSLLVRLFAVFAVLTPASFFISGNRVRLATVVAGLLGLLTVHAAGRGQVHLSRQTRVWLVPLIAVASLAFIGIIASPFPEAASSKGVVQLVGLTITALAGLGTALHVRSVGLVPLLRVLTVAVLTVAGIGLFQWIVSNTTGNGLSFAWLNRITGGTVWRDPGSLGGFFRSNSIMDEPAHYSRVLSAALGIAVVRLGLLGRKASGSARPVVSRVTASVVLIALFLAGSVVGYASAALVVAATWAIGRPFRPRQLIRFAVVSVLTLSVVASLSVGSGVADKAATFTDMFASVQTVDVRTENVSALALRVNWNVTLNNVKERPLLGVGLGGHPAAYSEHPAARLFHSDLITGLNAEDAGSMAFRLVSETGILGSLLYLLTFILIVRAARRILLENPPTEDSTSRFLANWTATTAILGSTTAILITDLVRYPHYYDPLTWLLVGLSVGGASWIQRHETQKRSSQVSSDRTPGRHAALATAP